MGDSLFPADKLTAAVECDEELVEYRVPEVGETELKIAEHIVPLIPKGATLQVGIGNVPEAVFECLPDGMGLGIAGMGVDSIDKLRQRGVVKGPVYSIELLGTRVLWDFVHENPFVQMQVSDVGHNPGCFRRCPCSPR